MIETPHVGNSGRMSPFACPFWESLTAVTGQATGAERFPRGLTRAVGRPWSIGFVRRGRLTSSRKSPSGKGVSRESRSARQARNAGRRQALRTIRENPSPPPPPRSGEGAGGRGVVAESLRTPGRPPNEVAEHSRPRDDRGCSGNSGPGGHSLRQEEAGSR